MLNIGLLAPGAGEYYIGEVATSAEDYYSGRGENAGRWVGSLAAEIGLEGEVDPADFRSVLAGRDPHSGAQLVHRKTPGSGEALTIDPNQSFDVLRAASALGVSGRYVRQLLADGSRYMTDLDNADGAAVAAPKQYLVGQRRRVERSMGPTSWTVSGAEIQRFAESRTEKKFRPGYDLTLRPPKSVSIMWAIGGPEVAASIRAAHTAAVDEVVRYYEQQAVWARAPQTGRRVATHGIIAAAFDHRTSRAGDPLLHTHVVTANMTRFDTPESDEPVWRAVESSALFDHSKAAGCLYQAHLRWELTNRLGVNFGDVSNGCAEIDGIPDEVIDLFSKRRNEIEEELAATGKTSARAAQVATLETRKSKDYSVDADTLKSRWITEAAELGFTPEHAMACVNVANPTAITHETANELLDFLAGPHGLCERNSTFRRSDVIETISTAVGTSASARQIEELADRFLIGRGVVAVEPAKGIQRRTTQQRWTTAELARIEANLLEQATNTLVSPYQHLTTTTIDDAIAQRPELSDEQARMIEAACASDRFIQPIEGRPGAGKTYATEAIVAAHVAAGIPILGCAVSAAAAAELESQAAFDRSLIPATTAAKLLYDLDRGDHLATGTVLVVDEASMIGTRDLARLATQIQVANGRLLLVGDPDQHGSVDVGGVFARLCQLDGDNLIKLTENRRQDDHVDRLAIDDYRNGLISDAMGRLDDTDKIVRSATAGESFDAMVADWYAARLEGSADPMIAGPNSTRRALNERARIVLKAAGELDGEPLSIGGREFLEGDEVVARRNDRKLHAAGSRDFVKNGSTGVIDQIHHRDAEVTVRFEKEGTIRMPRAYLAAGRLEHGYARTTYGVQGHTHDVARYHPTDASGFEEGYVAVTRGRKGAKLYVVDGTIGVDQDTHHSQSTERHTLDDINTAMGRRRANTMASDTEPHIDQIATLAATRTLRELRHARKTLDQRIDEAPRDTTGVTEESTRARDALLVRRRALTEHSDEPIPDGLQRRIDYLEKRIASATIHQQKREAWIEDHTDLLTNHKVLLGAERAVETRIRQNPLAHLPKQSVEAIGSEPSLQRQRSGWSQAVSAVAVHHHRHGIESIEEGAAEGLEAAIGRRPAEPDAAASWDFAATKLTDADLVPELESGVEI